MTDVTNDAYSRALVSYVDVLGFGDFISESRSDSSKISRIANLLVVQSAEGERDGMLLLDRRN
jgi:hypothetical protein